MTARICYAVLSAGLVFSVICLLEPPAHAYVDPGSGLLAYQTLSAFLTGILFYFRQRIHRAFHGPRRTRSPERHSL
jgi:hypothetical protein